MGRKAGGHREALQPPRDTDNGKSCGVQGTYFEGAQAGPLSPTAQLIILCSTTQCLTSHHRTPPLTAVQSYRTTHHHQCNHMSGTSAPLQPGTPASQPGRHHTHT